MKGQAAPYIMFDGNAREALAYYKELFGGEITDLKTYAEAGYGNSPDAKDRLIHGRFQAKGLFFMVSDTSNVVVGNNISLVLDFESEEEIQQIYTAFRAKGTVHMELQDTFWGSKYAKVKDPFGIIWDLNYQKS